MISPDTELAAALTVGFAIGFAIGMALGAVVLGIGFL